MTKLLIKIEFIWPMNNNNWFSRLKLITVIGNDNKVLKLMDTKWIGSIAFAWSEMITKSWFFVCCSPVLNCEIVFCSWLKIHQRHFDSNHFFLVSRRFWMQGSKWYSTLFDDIMHFGSTRFLPNDTFSIFYFRRVANHLMPSRFYLDPFCCAVGFVSWNQLKCKSDAMQCIWSFVRTMSGEIVAL